MTPPQSPDIERTVLSACLFEREAIEITTRLICADVFFKPAHAVIYQAIDALYTEGAPVDQTTITEELRTTGKLELVGGEAAVASLAGEITGAANVEYHCKVLREKAFLRKTIAICTSIRGMAESQGANPEEIISALDENIHRLKNEFQFSPEQSLAERVREFVLSSPGVFLSSDVVNFLSLSSRVDKQNISKVCERLIKDGLIERHGDRRGMYRRIDQTLEVMDLNSSIDPQPVDLIFPLGIHELVKLYRKNIIIVAGESNAGKTAFLLNFIRLNMHRWRVRYLSSESGEEELRERLSLFDDMPFRDWNFQAISRSANFSDVIDPDGLNVIDFLERYDEFYRIGEDIRKIFDRLGSGLAVVAIQKNPGQVFGRGGAMSVEKARLYIGMEHGKITLVKAKNWRLKEYNPNGLCRDFKLAAGCKFFEASPWYLPKK